MTTVNNPATPYVGPIPGGIQDGTQIHIKGVAEHHHTGFLISLQCGGSIDPRSECALAFNPRFNENQVIRNSLQGGSWGAEERHGGFPFHKGQHVDVTIHAKAHCYSISVNGRHFCDFNHRVPKHAVTHIAVEQGIRVNHIRFQGGFPHHGGGHHHGAGGIGSALGQFAGALFKEVAHAGQQHGGHHHGGQHHHQQHNHGAHPYPGQPAGGMGPIYNPVVPFVHHVGGLYPNKMICISGIPHPSASRFSVYIQQGSHHEPREIAMVVDIRFMFNNDRNCVVRNHKQGNWGTEERPISFFPFNQNTPFEMIVLVEPHCFKVAVNNQHLLEFNHRLQPLGRFDTLRIDGDVRLTQVRFQG